MLPTDSSVSTCVCVCVRMCLAVYVRLLLCEDLSISLPVCVCVCVCVRARSPPALKHQQQITDGPPALEVFYFPAEARYVINEHVQH